MSSSVNVSVKELRKSGYHDLSAWLAASEKHVYVGRCMRFVPGAAQSPFANPFSVERFGRDQAIDMYERYLTSDPGLMRELPKLRGCVLGCWCKPLRCHADVILKLMDAQPCDVAGQ